MSQPSGGKGDSLLGPADHKLFVRREEKDNRKQNAKYFLPFLSNTPTEVLLIS